MNDAASQTRSHRDRMEVWPLLFVKDLERSISFYCDKLGFALVRKAESDGKVFWCHLSRQGCSLMLQEPETAGESAKHNGRGVFFYFVCEDVDRIRAELTKRGLSLPAPETAYYGMRQVEVTDPNGYNLCFESKA